MFAMSACCLTLSPIHSRWCISLDMDYHSKWSGWLGFGLTTFCQPKFFAWLLHIYIRMYMYIYAESEITSLVLRASSSFPLFACTISDRKCGWTTHSALNWIKMACLPQTIAISNLRAICLLQAGMPLSCALCYVQCSITTAQRRRLATIKILFA